MTKKSKKGLSNPAAIIAAAPTVVKSGGAAAKKVNKDTGNALSWMTVAGLGIVLFFGYRVFNTIGKVANTGGIIIDEIGGAVTTNPDHGGGNVGNANSDIPHGATITGVQAETLATQLIVIMGSFHKNNEKERNQVYDLLRGKTLVDYQMISAAFGLVRRNPITGEVAPPLLGQKLNLTEWLTVEMGPEGMNELRNITHQIF